MTDPGAFTITSCKHEWVPLCPHADLIKAFADATDRKAPALTMNIRVCCTCGRVEHQFTVKYARGEKRTKWKTLVDPVEFVEEGADD